MPAEVFQVKKTFDEGKHHIHVLLLKQKDNPYLSICLLLWWRHLSKRDQNSKHSSTNRARKDDFEWVSIMQTHFQVQFISSCPSRTRFHFQNQSQHAPSRARFQTQLHFWILILKHLPDGTAREVWWSKTSTDEHAPPLTTSCYISWPSSWWAYRRERYLKYAQLRSYRLNSRFTIRLCVTLGIIALVFFSAINTHFPGESRTRESRWVQLCE